MSEYNENRASVKSLLASVYNNHVFDSSLDSNSLSDSNTDNESASSDTIQNNQQCGCGNSCDMVCGNSCNSTVDSPNIKKEVAAAIIITTSSNSIGLEKLKSSNLINKFK